jgi:hypothetical protein
MRIVFRIAGDPIAKKQIERVVHFEPYVDFYEFLAEDESGEKYRNQIDVTEGCTLVYQDVAYDYCEVFAD